MSKVTQPEPAIAPDFSTVSSVKSALTGQTVLLPNEDVQEYATFLANFQRDFKPVGLLESELVQIIVDCFWRQRRIQALEFALYAHGHAQFRNAFDHVAEDQRYNMILLQTNLTYEKQFRNYNQQEARLDRKRGKAMDELRRLQADRSEDPEEAEEDEMSDNELFAALDAGYVPPAIAAQLAKMAQLK